MALQPICKADSMSGRDPEWEGRPTGGRTSLILSIYRRDWTALSVPMSFGVPSRPTIDSL
jgi:hypothetical protein